MLLHQTGHVRVSLNMLRTITKNLQKKMALWLEALAGAFMATTSRFKRIQASSLLPCLGLVILSQEPTLQYCFICRPSRACLAS